MFKIKDKCYKVNAVTNKVETVNNQPKVYTIANVDNYGVVHLYNNPNVLFNLRGTVINAPPLIGKDSSNWWNCKLVKIEEYNAN